MAKFAIYQILPRLFGNPNSLPTINGTIEENGSGKFNFFTNEVLQSIKSLGVTHLWFTGIIRHATTTNYPNIPTNNPSIVKGKAGSPYAITDYYDVSPDLAVNPENRFEEFEELVRRTHSNGFKFIIDFVPNHLSREYKSIKKPSHCQDFGESDNLNRPFDPQNNFYYLPNEKLILPFPSDYHEFPAKASGNDIFHAFPSQNDWYETVKLNYGIDFGDNRKKHFSPTPKTWIMMRNVLFYWAQKGIDGFRCDMAEMVPVEFWEWAIPQVKEINPDLLFIAEIYNPQLYSAYLDQGKFDYLYDKVGLYDQLRAIIEQKNPAARLSNTWKSLNDMDNRMLRFLENHDEQRIASKNFAQYPPRALPAFFVVSCMHQNPFLVYFGQEFGEEAKGVSGFSGNDGRTTLFDYWNVPTIQKWMGNKKPNVENLSIDSQILYANYQEIIKFSLTNKAISEGAFYDLMWVNKDNKLFNPISVFAFIRTLGKDNFLCLANFSKDKQTLTIQISEHAFEFCAIKNARLLNFVFMDYFSKNILKISGLECIEKGIQMELLPFSYVAYQF